MIRPRVLWATLCALALVGCAGPPEGEPSPAATGDVATDSPREWSGTTRHVPAEYPTIQAAVDAAEPGDLVLIEEGVYLEAVDVRTPGVTIRWVDRNEVIIDGEFERANGIQALFTDGVVVENLTTINHRLNGVFWSGVYGVIEARTSQRSTMATTGSMHSTPAMASAVFYGDMPYPPDQPQMPGRADAPVVPAVDVFANAEPDIEAVDVPAMPSDLEVTQQKGFNIMGVTFASTIGGFVGLHAYVLPLVLYAAWVVIAVWEIITRREDLSRGAGIGWILIILVVPFLGVIGYYLFGKSRIPAAYRWVLLAGGMGAYLLFLVLGLYLGGVV